MMAISFFMVLGTVLCAAGAIIIGNSLFAPITEHDATDHRALQLLAGGLSVFTGATIITALGGV